jgi:hypothetical protein
MTKVRNQADVLQRLPCLVAHLICESLGYFTPQSAANAIAHYAKGEAFCCEWYHDWASKRFASGNTQYPDLRDTVKEVGELAVQNAVRRRGHHRGPMAEFKRALALVLHVRQGNEGPLFASWF